MTKIDWMSCHIELVIDAHTTDHTLEEALPSAIATSCKSLVLRAPNAFDKVSNGAAVSRALAFCPNVQYLRVRLSPSALECVSLADLDLRNLRTLDMLCSNPTVQVLTGLLQQCPNLQTLSLGTFGTDGELRQTGPAPMPQMPQLMSYRQETAQDVFIEPLYACARTLRALTLAIAGPALLDLGHLDAHPPLTFTMFGGPPTLLDKRFRSALLGVRTLRHLALEYILVADARLFDAIAALMPQLVTLSVRARVPMSGSAYADLADQLLDVIFGGGRTALRALKVGVECYDPSRLSIIRESLGACCRSRRVRFSLESLV